MAGYGLWPGSMAAERHLGATSKAGSAWTGFRWSDKFAPDDPRSHLAGLNYEAWKAVKKLPCIPLLASDFDRPSSRRGGYSRA